jgi:hypothetical protein
MAAISLQSGIREYNQDITRYTGMLGGLIPDVHTLRSLNPETTNRVLCVMYRAPWFLLNYFGGTNIWDKRSPFATYKKVIEYYNMGIQCNIGDASLAPIQLQGGFAGRTVTVAGTQNTQAGQTLTITVPELVGRPMANFHNMWINGISDEVTGLTTYHGLVAGSIKEGTLEPQRIFSATTDESTIALEPSPANEVAEFLIIALDRSGARVEAAIMALGCYPSNKVGNDIFNSNNTGSSALQNLTLTYNCQFIQSAYVNDLATRYVKQFAVFGNSLNLNPGAGDAFFTDANATEINTQMFNGGKRPDLDAVQSGIGNAPVFYANPQAVVRDGKEKTPVTPDDHFKIFTSPSTTVDIDNPFPTDTERTEG